MECTEQKKGLYSISQYSVFLCTELGVGMTTEGIEVKSVGNTLVLHETALIEAFNLKAAIEYQLKKCEYIQKLQTKNSDWSEGPVW